MKKIISAVAAAALLIGTVPLISASAADVTACEFVLTPDKEFVHPGNNVTYTFSIIPNGDVYGLQAYLELPGGFEFVKGSSALVDGVKDRLKWDDVSVTESDKLLFSGFTATNPYTSAKELKIATFTCTVNNAAEAPSLSKYMVLNKEMKAPENLTIKCLPVAVPGLKKVAEKPSTCKEHGNNEYYICEDGCGECYKDAERKVKTTPEAETLPLAEHRFTSENISSDNLKSAATCVSPAIYFKRCANCGDKSSETFEHGEKNPNNHVGGTEIKNAVEATEDQEGYTGDKYCKSCGNIIEKGTTIPKREPTSSDTPSTPDTSDTPSTPDTSDTPSLPDTSDTPSLPDTSDTPSIPDEPSRPSTPDTSDTTSTPENSDTSSTPDMPSTSDKGSVIFEYNLGENAPKTEIITADDKLSRILLTGDEQKLFNDGYNLRVILSVDNIDNSVSENDKAQVNNALASLDGYKVGQFYDVKLYKVFSGQRQQVTAASEPISVALEIPAELRDQNRGYKVVRIHDGKSDVLDDRDFLSSTVTFESDRFSTYAIVYRENVITDSDTPYTGVESTLPILIAIGVIALLICVILFFTTGKNGLSEEKKQQAFDKLIAWGKRGGKIRSVIALALISVLLVYYYGIGMKTSDDRKQF